MSKRPVSTRKGEPRERDRHDRYLRKCDKCKGTGRCLVRVGERVMWLTCLECGGSGEQR